MNYGDWNGAKEKRPDTEKRKNASISFLLLSCRSKAGPRKIILRSESTFYGYVCIGTYEHEASFYIIMPFLLTGKPPKTKQEQWRYLVHRYL